MLHSMNLANRTTTANGYHRPWTSRRRSGDVATMDEAALKTLGSRIRDRRKALSWTQEELADQAGLDRSYIGGVERGGRNLTFTVLRQIARALDCPVAQLMTDV